MFIFTNGIESDNALIIDGNEESRSNTARHSKPANVAFCSGLLEHAVKNWTHPAESK